MGEVVLSEVQKRFRSTVDGRESFTLGPVDFTLPEGKLTVLAGPSGCGKTTLLRLIAGLETPDSGSISIGGQVMEGVPPHRRNVAMVFQDHALYPHMTVRANLAFPLRMGKTARAEIENRVRETAERLEIGELLDRRPDELSGGQQQRVALGRAIIRHPQVSLLDEPLAHLDAPLRSEMRDLLIQLQRRLGLTMLHVTHDQAEAAAMADRIVVLNDGQIEQVGTAADLYETPSSQFVARFFGTPPMNLLDGRLQEEGDTWEFVSSEGLRVPLDGVFVKWPTEARPDKVTLGIRPHDLLLGEANDVAVTSGQVVSVEQFDGSLLVRINLGAHSLFARCRDQMVLSPGSSIKFSIPPDRVYLFDGGTGGRLLHKPGGLQ